MLTMGLRPLDPARWIEPDHEWQEFHQHKLRCLETRRDAVLQVLEGSTPAQEELRDYLTTHLLEDHAATFSAIDGTMQHTASGTPLPGCEPPILEAALRVQDDLCLMESSPEGYRLTAALLCSPSYWHLEDKIGRTMDQIHEPVPGYAAELAKPANRFFERLEAGNPVWRAIWTVTAHSGLMQRFDPPTPGDVDQDPLWLRVERQTVTRLPETRAICFTIRLHQYPLEDVLAVPEQAEAFHVALKNLSPEEVAYKSLASVRHRLP